MENELVTNQDVETFVTGLAPTDPAQLEMFDKHWRYCFKRGLEFFLQSKTKAISCSIINNEVLAALYIQASGTTHHASDCATSCAPAETPGPCDCVLAHPPAPPAQPYDFSMAQLTPLTYVPAVDTDGTGWTGEAPCKSWEEAQPPASILDALAQAELADGLYTSHRGCGDDCNDPGHSAPEPVEREYYGPHLLTARNGDVARCSGDIRVCQFCAALAAKEPRA